ncbi:cysteine desulfurase [Ktedonobacteria bacterium brp13]|nr:cysteine desulfurase [Ktedonobacteria bacterium brp13]
MINNNVHPGLKDGPIYLDYNATTPVDPAVVDSMLPFLSTYFGNPSSGHSYADAARTAIMEARRKVADLLSCQPDEVIFTGCGTESDALAIRGIALAQQTRGKHIITQVTEHPAVLNICKALERWHGFRITYLPVDSTGRVDPAAVANAIDEQTTLITIMHANNETGTLQPLPEIAQIAHQHGVLFHSDAAQSVGKIATDVQTLGVDLLTVAGHKLYAPKGIGALYIRQGVTLEPWLYGGGQERGLRSGTENTAAIVALGAAAEKAYHHLDSSQQRLSSLRDHLHTLLAQALPGRVHLNGHRTERLPNTLNISINGIIGEELLASIPEIASSTGSACHAGTTDPSPVLTAMGLSREHALAALRLTLGRWSTREEIERAAQAIIHAIKIRG